MLLGDTSVKAFWLVLIIVILGVAIWYGTRRTSNLSRRERAQLDRNTEFAQRRDDPQKAPSSRDPSQRR